MCLRGCWGVCVEGGVTYSFFCDGGGGWGVENAIRRSTILLENGFKLCVETSELSMDIVKPMRE